MTDEASLKIQIFFISYNFQDKVHNSMPTTHNVAHIQEYDIEKNKDKTTRKNKLDMDSEKLRECLIKPDDYFKDKKDDLDINVTKGEEERAKILNATKDSKIKFPVIKTYDARISKCETELKDNHFFKQIKLPEFTIVKDEDTMKLTSYILNAQYILKGRLGGILDNLSLDLHRITLDKNYYFTESIVDNFYIAVYCDIIEPQYFGNKQIELIKCIPVVKDISKSALINYFDNPHYMPVRLNYINSIRIRLQDLHDNLIYFKSGAQFVIAKLHFRKIK